MTPEEHLVKLGLTAADVERLTEEAYREIVRLIRDGEAPRAAIAAVQATWAPAYVEVLAGALGERLGRAVGSAEVREMPVADVTLSRRLYAEQRQVSAAVADIVKRHAAGFQQARELTLEIFEGYGFKDREALRLDPRNPQLPKYLRELIRDPGIRGELERIMARAQASRLVTKPLRAAYLQAIDALAVGAGEARLEKLLRTAYYERMRYFANRIAQTELHRAYTHQQAKDLMADDEVEWVQWRLSVTHPRPDICDLHAHVDRYGLGPGVYPKSAAPVPPSHPFCRCVLSPRLDLTGRQGREKAGAETAWLRQSDHAQRIVGSRAKWERVKAGADPMTVAYENAEPVYRPKSVAETADWISADTAILGVVSTKAYEAAIPVGGPHHGMLENYRREAGIRQIEKGIRSLEKRIAEHEAWIADPSMKLGSNVPVNRLSEYVDKKWPKDIARQRAERDVLLGLLAEKRK